MVESLSADKLPDPFKLPRERNCPERAKETNARKLYWSN